MGDTNRELTDEEMRHQDFVDNEIYQLIQQVNPTAKEIDWDIEMIGNIRDVIQRWLVENLEQCTAEVFYPFIEIPAQY